MKLNFFNMLFAGALAAGLASCGNSNTEETVGEKIENAADSVKVAVNDMMDKDRDFVQDVLKANHHEILMLQAGIDHGTNATLKSDAKSMLADHQKLEDQLKDYATRKNIEIPSMDETAEDLNAKPGKEWDKAWADKMVDGHEKTVDKFESNQNDLKDSELQTMAMNTLPTLRSHLEMCQALQAKLK